MDSMPFVRCVGIGTTIWQNCTKKAYDWRLIFILQGGATLELGDAVLQAEADQLYVIPPGTAFRVYASDQHRIAVINFDGSQDYAHLTQPILSVDAGAFQPEKILSTGPVGFLEGGRYRMPSGKQLLFEQLYRLYLRDDLDGDRKRFLLSAGLIGIIAQLPGDNEKTRMLPERIYDYILEHACEKLTLEETARRWNYSASYIEKLLRRHYATSFRQLVVDTRLKKALWLLENTSDSCAQIAAQLGFYSSQHFTQSFKKKYHRTPSEYR